MANQNATVKKTSDHTNPWRFLSRGDKIFLNINDVLLLIALVIVLYPVIYIVSSSISSPRAVSAGMVRFFPVDFSLEGYAAVFDHAAVMTGFANTIFYTVVGTAINLVFTVLAAYPLSRARMPGKKVIAFMFTFTMIFSGGLIPSYMLNSDLHLTNTRLVLLIPGAVSIFNMIICRTFFTSNIPEELNEAAQIDGCDHIRFLFRIALPLSKPILAVLTLYYAVSHWNAYFDAFIYISDKDLFPLQIILRNILIMNQTIDLIADPELMAAQQGMADLLKYSLIVTSSLPFMLAYPFVAKHFVKGALTGAVKG
jgi:multiple sugar transport system permease protein/putative aldouronate transport system permease protein